MRAFHRSANNAALDRIGVAVSSLCAAHCALWPLLLGVLPWLGWSLLRDARAEWGLLALAATVGLLSLAPSYVQRHRQGRALALFVAGVSVMLLARLLLAAAPAWELAGVLVGAVIIASAHALNLALCRACPACQAVAISVAQTDE